MIKPENIEIGDTLLCEVPIKFMEEYPNTVRYNNQKFEVFDKRTVYDINFHPVIAICVKGINIIDSFKIRDDHYDWFTKIDKY